MTHAAQWVDLIGSQLQLKLLFIDVKINTHGMIFNRHKRLSGLIRVSSERRQCIGDWCVRYTYTRVQSQCVQSLDNSAKHSSFFFEIKKYFHVRYKLVRCNRLKVLTMNTKLLGTFMGILTNIFLKWNCDIVIAFVINGVWLHNKTPLIFCQYVLDGDTKT